MDDYQKFIAFSRYARWRDEDNRRETWEETVSRYIGYMKSKVYLEKSEAEDIEKAILDLDVMPSMRLLMTSGPAVERCNVAAYNCSYVPIDDIRAFDEVFYILMCGTGVGFSVERKYVNKLPVIANEMIVANDVVIRVGDSKAGWAEAYRTLLHWLYKGVICKWDLSLVRPKGARLKTFGGRSSGPGPLEELFQFTVQLMTDRAGTRLRTIDCHDLVCKIAQVVVVGGVRRSALISLGDLDDDDHRKAKQGSWWVKHGHRALANNSAVYEQKPSALDLGKEWLELMASGSGERGIFNRQAAQKQAGVSGRRDAEGVDFGTNPCSEIILRPYQFCNLTEVVVRPTDTITELRRKVFIATLLGTYQATLTNFDYLRPIWRETTESERLLGVSLTGMMDNPISFDKKVLEHLRQVSVDTNKFFAERFKIPVSAAITCVKPSGTVSQLVDSASGIHPRPAKHYIRTVRADNKDPLTQFLKDQGVPNEPELIRPEDTTVFSFWKQAKDSVTRNDITAIEHLEKWHLVQRAWCEHKPSVTINVDDHEWFEVLNFVYRNFDDITGVAFLPKDNHTYQQAPEQPISEEDYKKAPKLFVDWSKLPDYEKEDNTTGAQELACTGGVCEIVDLVSQ
jgi:ribonucleoside-diphosphate reductase alpha chain